MTYHNITLLGNLGKDPEMHYTESGQAVVNFTVATNADHTRNGEKVIRTTWFRVSVWGNNGEKCKKYLAKGHKVLVIGTLNADTETGNPRIFFADGEPRARYEVTAKTVKFLGSPE